MRVARLSFSFAAESRSFASLRMTRLFNSLKNCVKRPLWLRHESGCYSGISQLRHSVPEYRRSITIGRLWPEATSGKVDHVHASSQSQRRSERQDRPVRD